MPLQRGRCRSTLLLRPGAATSGAQTATIFLALPAPDAIALVGGPREIAARSSHRAVSAECAGCLDPSPPGRAAFLVGVKEHLDRAVEAGGPSAPVNR